MSVCGGCMRACVYVYVCVIFCLFCFLSLLMQVYGQVLPGQFLFDLSSFFSLKCYTKFVFCLGLCLLMQVYGQLLLGPIFFFCLLLFSKFKMLY